jgi:outer membrane protein
VKKNYNRIDSEKRFGIMKNKLFIMTCAALFSMLAYVEAAPVKESVSLLDSLPEASPQPTPAENLGPAKPAITPTSKPTPAKAQLSQAETIAADEELMAKDADWLEPTERKTGSSQEKTDALTKSGSKTGKANAAIERDRKAQEALSKGALESASGDEPPYWDEEFVEEEAESISKFEEDVASNWTIPSVLTTLDECKRAGLINDKRVQVALREFQYERARFLEAERTFLPQVKANWEKQAGDSAGQGGSGGGSDQAYSGLKYGLESQQLLFNGGKLINTLKQAKANVKAAINKFKQARQELIHKVEKEYYGLVKAQMAFEIQADLSKSAETGLSFSREAYRQGLNTYHEFLNVQSQTDQTYYQLLSAQQEVALAELKLRQACNLDNSIGIQINAVLTFTDFDFNYSLEECLDLGYKNRPDLAVNELTTLADVYGIKIAGAEGMPKVEFLANVGKSGQSQEKERLELGDEWSVKLQATWILGANSLQYVWEDKKSVPTKFGQQDNTTKSNTQQVSLAVFDKLENFSNLAKSRVQKATSEADLVELRGKVASEVQENYFNYQKAMTQVTAALSKIKFREKDLEINRAKQMMSEIELSQVLATEIQLAEERVQYVSALADYYTSISGLFKAMGLSK